MRTEGQNDRTTERQQASQYIPRSLCSLGGYNYLPYSYSIQHGTGYKTGLRLSVCLSICEHSHGRISWSIFTIIGKDVKTSKSKNEFVGGSTLNSQQCTTLSLFCPKTLILGPWVLKIHANLNNPIGYIYTALNASEAPTFSHHNIVDSSKMPQLSHHNKGLESLIRSPVIVNARYLATKRVQ